MKALKIIIGTFLGTIGLVVLICAVYAFGTKNGESQAGAEETPEVTEVAAAPEANDEKSSDEQDKTELSDDEEKQKETTEDVSGSVFILSLEDVPEYTGSPYVEINGNEPCFDERDISTESFERYSELDKFGRCGVAYANIGRDTMPTESRGNISEVKPAGWHTDAYDFIEGGNLYNRCHLVAFSLAAENANDRNLITGTRYMNADGMKPFEDMVASYVDRTGNHVLYRVTPMYKDAELIARGIEMEALSVEDEGEGIKYHVFVYNVQPGVDIDYATGDNRLSDADRAGGVEAAAVTEAEVTDRTIPATDDEAVSETSNDENGKESKNASEETVTKEAPGEHRFDYVGNKSTHKFHYPECKSVSDMKEKNKAFYYNTTRQEMLDMGYEPCGNCKP